MAGGLDTGFATLKGVFLGAATGMIVMGGAGYLYPIPRSKGYLPTAIKISKFLNGITYGSLGLIIGGVGGAAIANSMFSCLQSPSFQNPRAILCNVIFGAVVYKMTQKITEPILEDGAQNFSLGIAGASVVLASRF